MDDADRVLELLNAIRRGDEASQPMSNQLLVEHLGWTPAEVADCLCTARARLLIWGLPGWGNPRPQFNELELTVQGRRLLEIRPGDVPNARVRRAATPVTPPAGTDSTPDAGRQIETQRPRAPQGAHAKGKHQCKAQ